MLLVRNAPQGPERYQALVPQSISALGYWPLSVRLGLVRSSKVTVWEPAGGGGGGVAVAAGSGVGVLVGVCVAVGVNVGVAVAVASEGGGVGPPTAMTSIAFTSAWLTTPTNSIVRTPSDTLVVKTLSRAVFAPTRANTSKFCSTDTPSTVTLKTRRPMPNADG